MVEYHLNYCDRRLVSDYEKLNVGHLIHKTLKCTSYAPATIYPFEGWTKGYGGCKDIMQEKILRKAVGHLILQYVL